MTRHIEPMNHSEEPLNMVKPTAEPVYACGWMGDSPHGGAEGPSYHVSGSTICRNHLEEYRRLAEQRAEREEYEREITELRAVVEDVRMLVSSRRELRGSEAGAHLLRFCARVGSVPNPLREEPKP